MEVYFIKGYINNEFYGLDGAWEVIDHFYRENQSIETLIYTIIKACKSIEEWTIEVRLNNLKSPFKYGLTERDIKKLSFEEQMELLQYYCNVYLILYHISKYTLNKLDKQYNKQLNIPLQDMKGGDDIVEYLRKANRGIMDKFNRNIL
ncbi:hypothetical protein [Clostridium sp.]|uniref:hypothetical protein n=1 Tax=Clostridium sp. TaxID=1506 RepID=UPI0039904F27